MAFEIHPLGVRGSYPGSATRPSAFGQDTTCYFVRVGAQGLILDAGSGLTRLAPPLLAAVRRTASRCCSPIIISITSWGFRSSAAPPQHPLPVHGPVLEGRGPEAALRHLMAPPLIPVGLEAIGGFDFHPFAPGKSFSVGDVSVETLAVNHPGGSIAYKLTG